MSERGSWSSQMTYCDTCAEALRSVFEAAGLAPIRLALNRFAGPVEGLYANEEADVIEAELERVCSALCEKHDITVFAMPDSAPPVRFVASRAGIVRQILRTSKID